MCPISDRRTDFSCPRENYRYCRIHRVGLFSQCNRFDVFAPTTQTANEFCTLFYMKIYLTKILSEKDFELKGLLIRACEYFLWELSECFWIFWISWIFEFFKFFKFFELLIFFFDFSYFSVFLREVWKDLVFTCGYFSSSSIMYFLLRLFTGSVKRKTGHTRHDLVVGLSRAANGGVGNEVNELKINCTTQWPR